MKSSMEFPDCAEICPFKFPLSRKMKECPKLVDYSLALWKKAFEEGRTYERGFQAGKNVESEEMIENGESR